MTLRFWIAIYYITHGNKKHRTEGCKFTFIITSLFNKGSFFLWEEPTRCGDGVKFSKFQSSWGLEDMHQNIVVKQFAFGLFYWHTDTTTCMRKSVIECIQEYGLSGCVSFTQTESTTNTSYRYYISQVFYKMLLQYCTGYFRHLSVLILQGEWGQEAFIPSSQGFDCVMGPQAGKFDLDFMILNSAAVTRSVSLMLHGKVSFHLISLTFIRHFIWLPSNQILSISRKVSIFWRTKNRF